MRESRPSSPALFSWLALSLSFSVSFSFSHPETPLQPVTARPQQRFCLAQFRFLRFFNAVLPTLSLLRLGLCSGRHSTERDITFSSLLKRNDYTKSTSSFVVLRCSFRASRRDISPLGNTNDPSSRYLTPVGRARDFCCEARARTRCVNARKNRVPRIIFMGPGGNIY